jgi:hypothetical protein
MTAPSPRPCPARSCPGSAVRGTSQLCARGRRAAVEVEVGFVERERLADPQAGAPASAHGVGETHTRVLAVGPDCGVTGWGSRLPNENDDAFAVSTLSLGDATQRSGVGRGALVRPLVPAENSFVANSITRRVTPSRT